MSKADVSSVNSSLCNLKEVLRLEKSLTFGRASLLLYDYFNGEKNSDLNLSSVSELHDYDTRSVSYNLLSIPSS